MLIPYLDTVRVIRHACERIRICYPKEGDGRIISAMRESEYLRRLTDLVKEERPDFKMEMVEARRRMWYDIRINGIPFNLKMTHGGTDNVFNKVSVLYTLTGDECRKKNMNFHRWFHVLRSHLVKSKRDRETEYHFLVVRKTDHKVLIKSLLDIHTFHNNPCNILQVRWKHEFQHMNYVTPDDEYMHKVRRLLRTIQTSVRKARLGMHDFAEADMDELWTKCCKDGS